MTCWLVTEHGPIGSLPLLTVGAAMPSRAPTLVTTSLSSHLLALSRKCRSLWLDGWRRNPGATPGLDVARYGQAELARARRFTTETSAIHAAVRAIGEQVDIAWDRSPPSLVVIWERRRALGSLIARRALRAGVPVVTIQNGYWTDTVVVDRLIGEETLLSSRRPLKNAGEPPLPAWSWRRPAGIGAAPIGYRLRGGAGLWVDYLEKIAKASLGFPALIPGRYWAGFAASRPRTWFRRKNPTTALPASRFVLLALHTPPAIGWFAEPDRFAEAIIEAVPPEIPLVICAHPGDRRIGPAQQIKDALARHSNARWMYSSAAWPLLERCAVLITLSSAVGLEAVVRGIPTIALPSASYVRPGLAHPFESRPTRMIAEAWADSGRFAPDESAVHGFLSMLIGDHVVRASGQSLGPEAAAELVELVDRLVALPVTVAVP